MEKNTQDVIKISIKNSFKHFNKIFDSENEMYDYFLKFNKIYKSPDDAFYELFSISDYYRSLKIVKPDFLKLIMMISLIEKLNSKNDFQTFPDWIKKNRKKKQPFTENSITKIYSKYEKEHGCSSKFRNFFQEYLTKKEKIELIKSISYYYTSEINSESNLVPMFCYEEKKCKTAPYYSCPIHTDDSNSCKICNDEKSLKKSINEFAEFLYTLRSNFVHNAIIFDLASPQSITRPNGITMDAALVTYIQYKFRKIKKPEYKGMILLQLTADHLENILDHNFKNLLMNYTTTRLKSKRVENAE